MQSRILLTLLTLFIIGCPTTPETLDDDDSSEGYDYLSCSDHGLIYCWFDGNPANGRPMCADDCASCPVEDGYRCTSDHDGCIQQDYATCWHLGNPESVSPPVCAESCMSCPGRDQAGDGYWCG